MLGPIFWHFPSLSAVDLTAKPGSSPPATEKHNLSALAPYHCDSRTVPDMELRGFSRFALIVCSGFCGIESQDIIDHRPVECFVALREIIVF